MMSLGKSSFFGLISETTKQKHVTSLGIITRAILIAERVSNNLKHDLVLSPPYIPRSVVANHIPFVFVNIVNVINSIGQVVPSCAVVAPASSSGTAGWICL